MRLPTGITIRTDLRPGDIGAVISLHGILHGRECGFDATFEAYVAAPLAEFVKRGSPRERLWLVERDQRPVGCIAIVAASDTVAQLRWFLLDPSLRGIGLGRTLMRHALDFAQQAGYASITLWTVSTLTAAARLYRAAGFVKVEEKPIAKLWGVELVEERYEISPLSRGTPGERGRG
jgi:GNAT superfamily N-acetyltransferase